MDQFYVMKQVTCSYMFSIGDLVSLFQVYVCSSTTEFGDCTLQSSQSFLHQPSACDVVCMAVGVHYQKKEIVFYHRLWK